jgi:murein DD-endopeptidase MepM/ murein hydrolase activator NlpD
VKIFFVLLGIVLIGVIAWIAAGPSKVVEPLPIAVERAMGAAPRPVAHNAADPAPVMVATLTAPAIPVMQAADAPRPLIVPVAGVARSALHDMFNEVRGNRRHEAIDIMAPRGTPVIAAGDGFVKKLFTSVPGGLTVYEFDPDQRFCYYYAHLDGYAAGLHEGQVLRQGEILGYVGTSGNAPVDAPHLHFALIRLDADKRWWKGTYVDPYPWLAGQPAP